MVEAIISQGINSEQEGQPVAAVQGIMRLETIGEAWERASAEGTPYNIKPQMILLEPPSRLPIYDQMESYPFNNHGQVLVDGECVHDSK